MIKPLRFLPLALLLPALAQATSLEIDADWYVRIDGHYYTVDTGTIGVGLQQIALGTLATSLSNCRRSNGAGQIVTSEQLSYADGTRLVYLKLGQSQHAILFDHGAAVLDLTSATQDVVCDGEQLPPGVSADVFKDSFEEPVPPA